MPSANKKLLLVEGENDRLFFEICCKRIAKLHDVEVGPPSKLSEKPDGKNNAIDLFFTTIPRLAQDDGLTHLALVVDADAPQTSGLGFAKTWEKIMPRLEKEGYQIPSRPNKANGGIIIPHSDGLPPIGLWVMPDNYQNGFLEDFIKQALVGGEKSLLTHASSVVSALQHRKFKDHHVSKAEIATYMAWQETPGQGMHGALGAKLLEFDKRIGKEFIDWLKAAFA